MKRERKDGKETRNEESMKDVNTNEKKCRKE